MKLKAIQTDTDTLKDVLKEVVSDTVAEQLKKQRELDDSNRKIQKILKRDSIAAEVNKKGKDIVDKPAVDKPAINEHDSCPNCHADVKKLDDSVTICEGCGATTITKGADYLICETCNGIVPLSYMGTNKPCPHCGGTKVRRAYK